MGWFSNPSPSWPLVSEEIPLSQGKVCCPNMTDVAFPAQSRRNLKSCDIQPGIHHQSTCSEYPLCLRHDLLLCKQITKLAYWCLSVNLLGLLLFSLHFSILKWVKGSFLYDFLKWLAEIQKPFGISLICYSKNLFHQVILCIITLYL